MALLPSPYRLLHRVTPRSEALWRQHLSQAVPLQGAHPQVADVALELRASEEFHTKVRDESIARLDSVIYLLVMQLVRQLSNESLPPCIDMPCVHGCPSLVNI